MAGMRRMGPPGSAAGGGGGCNVNFPFLETLEMRQMPVLEAWHGIEHCQWFPRLRVLKITNCPMLRRLPPLPLELTKLSLCEVGLNALPEFWLPSINGDAGGNRRNSSLLSLSISCCPNLVSLREGLMASRRLAALQELKIDHCDELVVLPGGTSADFASLESVTIESCPKLFLPAGVPLPSSLKHVRITPCSAPLIDSILMWLSMTGLRALHLSHDSTQVVITHELIRIKDCGGLSISSIVLRSFLSPRGMSSISELEIDSCHSLTSISGEALHALTALRRLEISGCTALVCMGIPALAHLTALRVINCPEFMHLTSDVLPSSSSTTGHPGSLHSLTELCITSCPKIRSLGDEVLSCMPTLSKVEITDCAGLMSVRLHFLTSLRDLKITDCPKLIVSDRTVMPGNQSNLLPLEYLFVGGAELLTSCLLLSNPTSLRQLWITKCPQLASFGSEPEEAIKCLTSLELLTFAYCSDLQCLPSQLHSLRSLEELRIWDCPKVESLPDTGLPPSLRSLSILGCPVLATRCRTEGDPNWSRIAGVETLQIMEG